MRPLTAGATEHAMKPMIWQRYLTWEYPAYMGQAVAKFA
jgi:hypothetical protein